MALAAAGALVAVGLTGVAGVSLEEAERRTSLVGQLRFAVTLQDLRTVLVLRRQLALDLPRSRPWVPLLRAAGQARFPVWQRGWRGVLRWPAARLVRLAAAAGPGEGGIPPAVAVAALVPLTFTAASDDSPVARYLERKGEGIHHIAYRVADCAVALQSVKDNGGRVIDDAPRPGSGARRWPSSIPRRPSGRS